jgi:hypothetical protein
MNQPDIIFKTKDSYQTELFFFQSLEENKIYR